MTVLLRRSLLVALLGGMLLAPGARADSLLDEVTSSDCYRDISRPFTPWGDSALYFLAPNGDFADGAAGWQGGEAVQDSSPLSGGEGRPLGGRHPVLLPGGCGGVRPPTMGFFARQPRGPGGAAAR